MSYRVSFLPAMHREDRAYGMSRVSVSGPPSLQSPAVHDGFFTAISIPELSPCSAVEPEGSDAVGLGTARVSRAFMGAGTVKGTKGSLGLP